MKATIRYISVAVPLPVRQLYTYELPQKLRPEAAIGKRVLVPFGRRRVTGYIMEFEASSDLTQVKAAIDLLDDKPLFTVKNSLFYRWIADYYLYPIGQVIETALPSGINIQDQKKYALTAAGKAALLQSSTSKPRRQILKRLMKKPVTLRQMMRETALTGISRKLARMEEDGWLTTEQRLSRAGVGVKMERTIRLTGNRPKRLTAQRKALLEILNLQGEQSLSALKKQLPTVTGLIPRLVQENVITIGHHTVYRDPFGEPVLPDQPCAPTVHQLAVLKEVIPKLGNGFYAYLLKGVTGSGKTEVYLQLAQAAINQQLTVLVLVPEIALITQMVRRFQARFGKQVAVLHSGLSKGERYDQWRCVANKKTALVIGARSAIFAPLETPGLIIVDEEHDESYKQDSGLCYNARDLAVVRAKMANGVVLLGSATPSVQSLYNVRQKKFYPLSMPKRINKRPLPYIETLDLRYEKRPANSSRYLTRKLISAIAKRLEKKEQTLLFLNRRGFAGYPLCVACGQPVACRNCDITMTLHRSRRAFVCHYCGYQKAAVSSCGTCGEKAIKALGLGTEQLEQIIKQLFPAARVARMDRDTISRKGALVALLQRLHAQKIDILVGTQMIAKGHDFPGITLVGIISADQSLDFPDFRASERTFQLLVQVSGRAGRGTQPGEVILQTYNPDHYTIRTARTQSSKAFYNREIHYRRALSYPPFSRLALVLVTAMHPDKAKAGVSRLYEKAKVLRQASKAYQAMVLLGPAEAPILRISGRYRHQILLKAPTTTLRHKFLKEWLFDKEPPVKDTTIKIQVDVDPYTML